MTLDVLVDILKQNGIAGAGGAGFPTYAKLDKRADILLLNCAECEPLLRVHRQVMGKYAYEILSTLDTIAEAVGAKEVVIAIKKHYTEAVAAINENLEFFGKIRIGFLPEVYPAGDELIAIYETTGRRIEPGNIPISAGVTVMNVETVYNAYNAITNNMPVTEKYVTVTGEVNNPITIKAPIGMKFADLIKEAGGTTVEEYDIISGGPMTGVLTTASDVVGKTTNAILVMPKNHYIISKRTSKITIDMKRAMSACCQCRMCTDLCPRNLLGHPIEPHEFMRAATSGDFGDIKAYVGTMFCSGCGVCEMYSCGQNLSPKTLMATFKNELRKKGIPIPTDIKGDEVSPKRDYRKIPMKRLVSRLGLSKYDVMAPLHEEKLNPKTVKISLAGHIGAPSKAVVKKGDTVKRGQVIGKAAEGLSINTHSSIAGQVMEVTDRYILIKNQEG